MAGLADEEDWLELLVASERISSWLDIIKSGNVQQYAPPREVYLKALALLEQQQQSGTWDHLLPPYRQKQALLQLKAEIESRKAYAEEVRKAGAAGVLTRLIAKSDNDELCTLAAAIISGCSGNMHSKTREISVGGQTVWIQEGALGDGLGARLWASSSILCRELVMDPSLVRGCKVLELGSGCGLCGILAAKLGAAEVTLSDNEPQVLHNLRACVAGNLGPQAKSGHEPLQQLPKQMASGLVKSNHVGIDEIAGITSDTLMWDVGDARVRYLDWCTALIPEELVKLQQEDSNVGLVADEGLTDVPRLPLDEMYPVIIGSDLMYEASHAALLAAVIAQRLLRTGRAVLALAVRRQDHLERLQTDLHSRQMRVDVQQSKHRVGDFGIVGREHEYEGGFVLATIQHA